MAGVFKAYDVRGVYPSELDEGLALKVGLGFRSLLDPEALARSNVVVVSRDMRPHGIPLGQAVMEGLRSSGLDVIDIGLATTPMNYFAVGHLGAAGGIQVTASHNPAEYNGFKMSLHEARPVSGDHGIPLLEERVHSGELVPGPEQGRLETKEVLEAYSEHVLRHLEPIPKADRLRVVADAANGMGTLYLPLLERLGIDLVPLFFELDGTFPNHEANPLKLSNLKDLCDTVRRERADLGVAFDGDADRAVFVDEDGQPIGSDLVTALIAGELLREEPGQAVLYDLRSSHAVPEFIRECRGEPVRERVGHSFMKATLREKDGIFGGELAGHYYFRAHFSADCALLAVVEILNLLRRTGEPLSRSVLPLRRYAKSPEINFVVEDKAAKIRELENRYSDGTIDYLDGITVEYPDWWFNVRPSNTEPYLRLVLEASNESELAARRSELEGLLGRPV